MKIQLMLTCLCDAFYGEAGIATVKVLEHCGVEVLFPKDQTCCGQPAFNSGDWDAARKLTERSFEIFDPRFPIVVPSASCAAMLRHGAHLMKSKGRSSNEIMENPHPLTPSPCKQEEGEERSAGTPVGSSHKWSAGTQPAQGLRTLSPRESESQPSPAIPISSQHRVYELSEFLLDVLEISEWPQRGKANDRKRKIIFHQSCHGRMIGLGDRQKRLLNMVPNLEILEPEFPEQCCGFGGMFAAKQPHLSESIGLQKISTFRALDSREIVSGDMGCLMHLQSLAAAQNERLRVTHYAQILAEAIGG